jgi:predicted dehydrogenase
MRAGVIGLGVGEQHIKGYLAAGADVVAICDQDPRKLSEVHARYPDCRTYSSADSFFEAGGMDIVSIASFDHHHAHQVLQAIEGGLHVFVEKPLCTSFEELDLIRRAMQRRPEVRLSSNTILRMSERFRDIRDRVKAGDLGTLYSVEADYNYGRLHKVTSGWRGSIPDYSVMLGGGIHVVDLLIWIVGSRVVDVTAIGNKLCSPGASFKTPDMVSALLRFENGTVGKVSANFGCVYPHFHKLSVYGTHGTIENAITGAVLFRSRDPADSPERLTSAYPGVSKGDLLPGFIDSIKCGGNSQVTETDVFSTIATCLAIDRSLGTGKVEVVKSFQQGSEP